MLEIKNVTKKYGNKVAIENINLKIENGTVFGFIGHNGAGKTTLIKSIVGIHKFNSGDILLDNVSILKDDLAFKKMVSYVPDNPDIYPNFSGREYLNFIGDIFDVPLNKREELIKKYAEMFEVEDVLDNLISSYSHGMKQKIVIISSLIHDIKLLILDEPFVGLDPKSSKTLKDIIKELAKNGVIVFFSSHVLLVVEKLCDEIAIIKNGKILEVGKTKDIVGKKDLEDVFLELTDEK